MLNSASAIPYGYIPPPHQFTDDIFGKIFMVLSLLCVWNFTDCTSWADWSPLPHPGLLPIFLWCTFTPMSSEVFVSTH
jgi:hypothetical protein